MTKLEQCRAITQSGERCRRRPAKVGGRFCFQHTEGGGNRKKQFSKLIREAIPFAAAAAELVKIVIDTVGPLLSKNEIKDIETAPKRLTTPSEGIFEYNIIITIDAATFDVLNKNPQFKIAQGKSTRVRITTEEALRELRKPLADQLNKLLHRQKNSRGGIKKTKSGTRDA
jgi:hypothetical protein